MRDTLPVHVRDLTLRVHRDLARKFDGLVKSNDFRRDQRFLAQLLPLEGLVRLSRVGKQLDANLAASGACSIGDAASTDLPDRFLRYWIGPSSSESPVEAVRAARQCLLLFSKLDCDIPGKLSDGEAIEAFLERNRNLAPPRLTPRMLALARMACSMAVGSCDLRDISPRHGQGAVATREQPWQKMAFKRIYSDSDTWYPVDQYFFLNASHLCDCYPTLQTWSTEDHGVAKLAVVPKDFRGPRIISMEPLEKMWLQQGQARALMRHLESHPLTRGHVNFRSQEVNQKLALVASVSGEYSTIDLKDASDRVSMLLVEALVPRTVLQFLEATRSTHTRLPSKQIEPLNMFSPMGSAVCFPLESLIFWSLCVAALAHVSSCYCSPSSIRKAAKYVYVYGDDIIVPTEFFPAVCDTLQAAGLVVNQAKCCSGPHWRESCGWDCYDGFEVSPIRIKQLPDVRSPQTRPAAIGYINALRRSALSSASDYLEEITTREFGPIPRTTNPNYEMEAIVVESEAEKLEWNFSHFKSRFNRHLQRTEFLIPQLAVKRVTRDDGSWSEVFRAILYGSEQQRRLDYTVPHRVRLTTGWCAI